MCMLTYFPPGEQPDTEALTNGAMINRDGHGYAIVVPGKNPRLIVRHSLNSEYIIEQFAQDRAQYPDGPALFHSRIGTSGTQDKFNCHPFYMAHDKRTVVAHNGILPASMQPNKKDRRCDTRKAADERFAFTYGNLADPLSRMRLADAIGSGNKLVILTIDPTYGANSFIINEQSGVIDGNIWYSNYDFKGYYTPKVAPTWQEWTGYPDTTRTTDNDCPACFSKYSVDPINQVCTMCNSCMDCFEDLSDCICYVPASLELTTGGGR